MKINPLTCCDAYKLGHMAQYPVGTSLVYANFTPRTLKYLNLNLPLKTDRVVWFGLQGIIKEMIELWDSEFFKKDCEEVVTKFAKRIEPFIGPSGFNFDKIRELHRIGFLPLLFKALPEGSLVPEGVPCFTIKNTLPEAYWLVNYIESYLSAELWKMSTTATIAHCYRFMLEEYAEITGSSKHFVLWQGHDFSFRGMSGVIDAAKSGAAHLLSFTGSDTLPAVDYIEQYYHGEGTFVAGSVAATEHSVMCMGSKEREIETFKRLITSIYPAGIISIVSDTWDFWKVITEYALELKPEILSRKQDEFGNAKVVFRPDSGDPVKIICGDLDAPKDSPAYKGAIECLWEVFGGVETDKGYKLLDPHVGLIYGDSITPHRCLEILTKLMEKGFASGNIVLGIGSYTYQFNTRDTMGFAVKTTYGEINGIGTELFKDPITDSGFKKSAKGLLRIEDSDFGFELFDQQTIEQEEQGDLLIVFKDGKLIVDESYDTIKKRLFKNW